MESWREHVNELESMQCRLYVIYQKRSNAVQMSDSLGICTALETLTRPADDDAFPYVVSAIMNSCSVRSALGLVLNY